LPDAFDFLRYNLQVRISFTGESRQQVNPEALWIPRSDSG